MNLKKQLDAIRFDNYVFLEDRKGNVIGEVKVSPKTKSGYMVEVDSDSPYATPEKFFNDLPDHIEDYKVLAIEPLMSIALVITVKWKPKCTTS